ncbi:MAG TPA: efflux RND transporter periplasmic adaptor subunit [Pyrinomonadaceae bacterium]|nr:efflux RND transporter periplasmic adaptor subunit [Pyrinomonadaceae bacterium]
MEEKISGDLPKPSTAAGGPPSGNLANNSNRVRAPAKLRSSKTRARIVQIVSVLVLVLLLVLLWRFLGDRSAPKATGAGRGEVVPVETALVTQQDVPLQIKAIGNVEAFSTIAVRSQVEGTLMRVAFVPGQEVKKGDLLFMIDPRPLQAQLSQADANLLKAMASVRQGLDIVAKDEAIANNSRSIVNRDTKLIESGVISREEYDNAASKLRSDEATVRADKSAVANLQAAQKAEQAAVENARVQLSYTTIRAPLTGKTGNLAVTAGNLVRANDTTAMVTITTSAPIYVTFSVPEKDLMRIRQYASSTSFTTEVVIPGDEANHAFGKLSLVDNTVDMATGTVRLKATFQNDDRRLYPGQFVNVVLTLGIQNAAVVVPSQAVQIGQDKSFVYVVKFDSTAEMRVIKPGAIADTMTVIEDGLKPGEQVVTDGQLRLVPGAKVQPKGQGGGQGNRGQGGQGNQGGGQGDQGNQGQGGRRSGGGNSNQ